MNDLSSITLWERATIIATLASAFVQAVSWIFTLVAFFTKDLPKNHRLKSILDRTALILAGIAAVAALLGSIFSIRYTHLADQDSLELHNKLTVASDQSFSATEKAKQALLELTQTEGRLTTVTKELADAEQQLATSKTRLQSVEDLTLLITRMNADDALAFDLLKTFKGTPAQEASVKAALEAVVEAHRLPYHLQGHGPFKHLLTDQEAEDLLFLPSVSTYERLGALESLMPKSRKKKLFPKLISLASFDPSLDVRTAATQVVSNWTLNPLLRALDKDQLQSWWNLNGKDYFP